MKMAFEDVRLLYIALSTLVCCCSAQLTFHTDPLSNSFTLKAPGLQQSFTRYFGGKQRANLLQATPAPLQQQPQQYQAQHQPQTLSQYQSQYQPQVQAAHQSQYQPQYQRQLQPQYQTQYQPQYQQLGQSPFLRYSSSPQFSQPGQTSFPFEAAYEQPLPPTAPFAGAYPPQVPQFSSSYQGAEYAQPQAPLPQPAIPSYAQQMQQSLDSYQQENQQMQQMLQQQQFNQQQLLMDLYKTPHGQGRAITTSPGRSQPFYTADQYINFLNKQHQDVFSQQQNHSDRGYSFSPMSAYSNGVPATMTSSTLPMSMNYSPSTNSSRVNYTNGKLSYEY